MEIEIPRHIDDPHQFLLWSADEVVPFFSVLMIGIFLGQVFIFAVLAYFVLKLFRRFRDGRPDGYLLHVLYWVGIVPSKARTLFNPYIRRFLP